MADSVAPRAAPIPLPPPALFEVFRVRFIGQVENAMTVNVLHYESDHPIGTATKTEQIELLQKMSEPDSILSAYVSCMTSDWAFVQATVDVPTTPEIATFTYSPANLFGINAPPHAPNQSGVTLRKLTDFRGRRGRGRITMPAVPHAWVNGTALTEQSNYTKLNEELSAVLQGAAWNYRPCLFSTDKTTPFTARTVLVTGFKTNVILGTARRRKPGVGK